VGINSKKKRHPLPAGRKKKVLRKEEKNGAAPGGKSLDETYQKDAIS